MSAPRLLPAPDSVTVRMYRTGHGDCFLLAFAGKDPDKPVYVLIDCGYKPGSPQKIGTQIREITRHICEATGGHVDVAVITHEHQDHVNGITADNFEGLTIGELWMAWTEDDHDDLANALRAKFRDQLLGLAAAQSMLLRAADDDRAQRIGDVLAFELGGDADQAGAADVEAFVAAADDPSRSKNKTSIKLFKTLAQNRLRCLRPHEAIMTIEGADPLRVFVLGPPRDATLLTTLDPEGQEGFQRLALDAKSTANYFATAALAAAASDAETGTISPAPFAKRYCVQLRDITGPAAASNLFFSTYYGEGEGDGAEADGAVDTAKEVATNPAWRRIDHDWLHVADQLALDMNDQTNNGSLVLAFELGRGGKVLLFAGDAQRGNWLSWSRQDWADGDARVTARDLLARTVLYKVGHHCSHNATLNGREEDDYPNLAWMAKGDRAREFTAMITAVPAWAMTQKGWEHPLKSIKDALLKKASGRVFQTDTDVDRMHAANAMTDDVWSSFNQSVTGDRLYFDYKIAY